MLIGMRWLLLRGQNHALPQLLLAQVVERLPQPDRSAARR